MSRAPYCTINVSNLQSLCTSLLDEVLQIEEDVKLEVTAVLDRNPAEATFLDDATTPQRLVTAHVDISSIVENEKNGSRESVITSRLTAVANGSVLTLFSNAPSNEDDEEEKDPLSSNDVIAELEFDNNIEAVGWSGGGACVIVGDCAGMLHFVTRQGELVFSHRIVPVTMEASFVFIGFVNPPSSSSAVPAAPTLITILSNGLIVGIAKLPVSSVCAMASARPQALAAAVSKLTFLKCSIPSTSSALQLPLRKAYVYSFIEQDANDDNSGVGAESTGESTSNSSSNLELGVVVVDDHDRLLRLHIGNTTRLCCDESAIMPFLDDPTEATATAGQSASPKISHSKCSDAVLVYSPLSSRLFKNVVAAIFDESVLSFFHLLNNGKVALLASTRLERLSNTLGLVSLRVECEDDAECVACIAATYYNDNAILSSLSSSPKPVQILNLIGRHCQGTNHMCPMTVLDMGKLHLRNLRMTSGHSLLFQDAPDATVSSRIVQGISFSSALLECVGNLLQGCNKDTLNELLEADSDDSDPVDVANMFVGYIVSKLQSIKPTDDDSKLSLISSSLGIFSALTSCGDVLAVLYAILSVPCSSLELLYKAINTAHDAMENIGTSFANPDKASLLSRIFYITRALEISKSSTFTPYSDIIQQGDREGEENEEKNGGNNGKYAIHSRLLSLLTIPRRRMMWKECVKLGLLADATLLDIKDSSFVDADDVDDSNSAVALAASALQDFNVDSVNCLDDLVHFLRQEVLPTIYSAVDASKSPPLNPKSSSPSSPMLCLHNSIFSLANCLCLLAKDCEALHGNPFDAISSADLGVELLSTIQPVDEEELKMVKNHKNLYKNLSLQAAVWRNWGLRVSLDVVCDAGLEGLIFDRLWDIEQDSLSSDVLERVAPVVTKFQGDMDHILKKWIQDAVTNKVLVSSLDDPNNDISDDEQTERYGWDKDLSRDDDGDSEVDDEKMDRIARLVLGVNLIKDIHIRAQCLLLLFQVPTIDRVEVPPSLAWSKTDGPESKITPASDDQHVSKQSNSYCVDFLSELANKACPDVDATTREALQETMRLHRMKVIASKYGIASLDPRDSRQVRSAISIISSQVCGPDPIKDVLEFLDAWSTGYFDVSSLLARIVVHRVTDTDCSHTSTSTSTAEEESLSLKEANVRSAISLIPPARMVTVIEDSLSCLIHSLQELCDTKALKGSPGSLVNREDELQAITLCRGAIFVTSIFLDEKRSQSSCHDIAQTHTWVNSEVLLLLKRLRTLQLEMRVFLSVAALCNSSICRAVASMLADKRATELVETLKHRQQPSSSSNNDAKISVDLTPELRRACSLLNVSPVYLMHTVMKRLLSRQETSLAMDVVKTLCSESYTGSKSATNVSNSSCISSEDSDLLVDAAVTLCTLSAKQASLSSSALTAAGTGVGTAAGGTKALDARGLAQRFEISGDLLRNVSIGCPGDNLGHVIDLLGASDLVVSVYQRMEGSEPSSVVHEIPGKSSGKPRGSSASSLLHSVGQDDTVHSQGSFKPCESMFMRDGILMSPNIALGPLLRYSLREVQRRSCYCKSIGGSLTVPPSLPPSNPLKEKDNEKKAKDRARLGAPERVQDEEKCASDLEELVGVLQRCENHMLAVRVLLGSWNTSVIKAQYLRSSLLALSKKVLSYREIDTLYATACLILLPYDAMVKELKAAVPSIQSDFSRLRTVAVVGEELARMWDQENLLAVFQGLQTNARWWHTLSTLGLRIDPRTFQSSDPVQREQCIRAVVPQLLEKGGMDLEMAIEYCRQFDIEPEYGALCYIQLVLLQPPTNISDAMWIGQVRRAALRVEESSLLSTLRKLLPQLNSLDYEKIIFVCMWLLDLMCDEEDTAVGQDVDEEDVTVTSGGLTVTRKPRASTLGVVSSKPFSSNAPTSSSSSSPAGNSNTSEADSYKRYVDVSSFLASIQFPHNATLHLSTKPPSQSLESLPPLNSLYSSVPAIYRGRLPLWHLLQDPWTVLEPMMEMSPSMAGKLAPLCMPLRLSKDDFYAKKIIATYSHLSSSVSPSNPSDTSPTASSDIFSDLQDSISAISDINVRIHVLRVVYEKERHRNDAIALRALTAALALLEVRMSASSLDTERGKEEGGGKDAPESIKNELLLELVKLRSECTLRNLDKAIHTVLCDHHTPASTLSNISQMSKLLSLQVQDLGGNANLKTLIKAIFEIALETAWSLQLQRLRSLGTVLCGEDVAAHTLVPVVSEYLQAVGKGMEELAEHFNLLSGSSSPNSQMPSAADENMNPSSMQPPSSQTMKDIKDTAMGKHLTQSSSSSSLPNQTQLEMIRQALLSKLLSDVEAATVLSSSSTIATSTLSSSTSTSSTSSSAFISAKAGLWNCISESSITPSTSETRRREDLFLSFSLSVIVATTPLQSRHSYIAQLDIVARGQGARAMRRLTARSKLRAAQSIRFLLTPSEVDSYISPSPVGSAGGRTAEAAWLDQAKTLSEAYTYLRFARLLTFLYCLAELQETRLPFSEEALMTCLGYLLPQNSSFPSASSISSSSASSMNHASSLPPPPSSATSMASSRGGNDISLHLCDPFPVVRTWLHDEGSHADVVELARDLLLASHPSIPPSHHSLPPIWDLLLRHMQHRLPSRTVFHSLLIIRDLPFFQSLCVQSGRGKEWVSVCVRVAGEVVDKAETMLENLQARQQQLTSKQQQPNSTNTPSLPAVPKRTILVERVPLVGMNANGDETYEDLILSLLQIQCLWQRLMDLIMKEQGHSSDSITSISASTGTVSCMDSCRDDIVAMGKICLRLISLASDKCSTPPDHAHSPVSSCEEVIRNACEKCGLGLLSPAFNLASLSSTAMRSRSNPNPNFTEALDNIIIKALTISYTPPTSTSGRRWRVLKRSSAIFDRSVIHKALTELCSPQSSSSFPALLAEMLTEASECWDEDTDSHQATAHLLSWCVGVGGSSAPPPTESHDMKEKEKEDKARRVDAVTQSIKTLSNSQKKSLAMAADVLGSRLGSRERQLLHKGLSFISGNAV